MSYRISMVAVLALSVGLLAGLAGCSKMTKDNYDMVKTGMTIDEVKKILGEPDETKSGGGSVLGVGGTSSTLTWKSGDKSITITFVDSKVLSKTMSNL